MNELKTTVKLDPTKLTGGTSENAILRQLTNIINNDGFGETDAPNGFVPAPPENIPTQADQQAAEVYRAPALAQKVRGLPSRVFMTGRMKVGKDFILKQFNFLIRGFADPLYAIQDRFFPGTNKQSPGARRLLQVVGQWGRGVINEQYPLSTERAVFEAMVRASADDLPAMGVNWAEFGRTDRLWVDALLRRVEVDGLKDTAGIGVSNVRFENEYKTLTESGWTHFHVMCSPETWSRRLREAGLTPQSPLVNDLSEKLAIALDEDSLKRARLKPVGPKLRVIWNDPGVRPPSSRFYVPSEFGV